MSRELTRWGSRILLAALILASPEALAKNRKKEAGYLSPPEVLKVAERSKVDYRISPTDNLEDLAVERFPEVLWPRRAEPREFPWVVESTGSSRSGTDYPLEQACIDILREAEPLFDAKRYDEALPMYLAAAKEYPRCYLALSHVGDCHYFERRYDEALAWYDKAIAVNPYDHRSHFYKGDAHFRLEEPELARMAYARVLALRPHDPEVVKVADARAVELGIVLDDRPFRPRALARREGDTVAVYWNGDEAHWLVWGLCKGIWLGEAEHRRERLGTTDHDWSTTEEQQCLLSLLESYVVQREDRKRSIPADPEMERLLAIAADGFLDEYVLYEMGSRVYPDVMLLLSNEERRRVERFVEEHVLKPREEKE